MTLYNTFRAKSRDHERDDIVYAYHNLYVDIVYAYHNVFDDIYVGEYRNVYGDICVFFAYLQKVVTQLQNLLFLVWLIQRLAMHNWLHF
jgi:hypothetical protein